VGTIDGGATVNLSTSISYQGKFASGPNLLIASYSPYSDIVWASVPEVAPNESAFNSVAMDDRFRNAYAGGYIVDNQEFTLNNGIKATGGVASVRNALVVKYDVDGAARWAKTIVSGQSDSEILAIAIDSDQSVYAAGYFSGNSSAYNFGNGVTLTGLNAGYNPFLIKYDIDGNAVWAKTLTTAPDQSKFLSIVVDSSKNIYVGGYLTNAGTYNFGNSVTVAGAAGSGRANAMLVKYNSSGVAQWAVSTTASSSTSYYTGLALNADQTTIYVSGYAESADTYAFGNSKSVTTPDGPCGFLIAYNTSGVPQWVQSSSGVCNSYFYGVTVDSADAVYVGGILYAAGTRDFGNSITASYTASEGRAILVKYNPSGTAQSAFVPSASTGGSPGSRYSALSGRKGCRRPQRLFATIFQHF
jgi:hypothetical protein